MEPEIKRRPVKKYVLIVIAAIVLLSVGAALGGHDSIPSSESSQVNNEVTADLAVQEETSEPAEYNSDIVDYANFMQDNSYQLSTAMSDMGETMGFYDGSAEWYDAAYSQIDVVNGLLEDAYNITAPAEMAEIHKEYMKAISTYQQCTTLLSSGLQTNDASLIDQSTALLYEADEYVQNTVTMLLEYQDQNNI